MRLDNNSILLPLEGLAVMIGQIRPQDRLMAMDRSTIWPYFPMLFSLIFDRAPPNFDILGACTAFIALRAINPTAC